MLFNNLINVIVFKRRSYKQTVPSSQEQAYDVLHEAALRQLFSCVNIVSEMDTMCSVVGRPRSCRLQSCQQKKTQKLHSSTNCSVSESSAEGDWH